MGSDVKENVLVFGRKSADGKAAIVAVTRSGTAQAMMAKAQEALGLAAGTPLKDALGGPDSVVDAGGKVKLVVPAYGAVMLAP